MLEWDVPWLPEFPWHSKHELGVDISYGLDEAGCRTYRRCAQVCIGFCTVWANEDEVGSIHGDVPWDTAPRRAYVCGTQGNPAPCTEQQAITKVVAERTPLVDVRSHPILT